MSNVHLTYRALSDLDKIYNYSLDKWGQKVAIEYLDKIEEALLLIQQYPELVKINPQISGRFTIYPVGEHFLVLDKLNDETYLLTVQSQRLDLLTQLAQLTPTLEAEVSALHNKLTNSRK